MSIPDQLTQLEFSIRQYEIEWRRFLGGATDTPPEPVEVSLALQIRNLQAASGNSTVDQFRLRGLEGRFNALREHFGHSLRSSGQRGDRAVTRVVPNHEVIVDDATPLDQTRPLFDAIYSNNATTTHEAFHRFLVSEAHRIRSRTNLQTVVYFLRREANSYKLSARIVEESTP